MPQPRASQDEPHPLRVIIADDRWRSRQGLRALLDTCPDLRIVGEASNGDEAIEAVAGQSPDVVVMDARMPRVDGLAATRLIKDRWPEVRVIVLTMYVSHRGEALDAGADAFVVKGCPPDRLLQVIQGQENEEAEQ